MKRLLLLCLAVVVAVVIGLVLFVSANADKIGAVMSGAVERATGRPLVLSEPPGLTFFPRLGISLGGAAWGGEKDDVHATIRGGTVRVALLPLLGKRVDIEAVQLDTPRVVINLPQRRPAAAARTASSAAGEPPSPGAPTGDAADQSFTLPDFFLAKLELRDGFVQIRDAGTTTELRDLELAASDIGPGREGALTVKGEFFRQTAAPADGARPAPSRAAFRLETALLPDTAGIRLNRFTARLAPADKKEALSLTTTGPVSFTLADETLTVDGLDVVLTSGAASLFTAKAAGTIRPRIPSGEITAQLDGSPKALLAAFGLTPATRDPQALAALRGSARLAFTPAEYRLSEFKATLDGTPLSGEATVIADGKTPLSVTARLAAGDISVDRYLPPAGGNAAAGRGTAQNPAAPAIPASHPASGQGGPDRAQWPTVDARLAVNRIVVSGIKLDKLNARLTGAAGSYNLRPCAFTLYEGPTSLAAGLNLAASPPRYTLDLKSGNVRLGALLRDAAQTDNVDGRVGLAAKLAALGPADPKGDMTAAVRRSLNGSGSMEGRDLVVRAGLVPSGAPGSANRAGSFTFAKLTGAFTAANGRVTLRNVALTGKGVGATAGGTLNLPTDQLDIHGVIQLAGLGIPVKVTGPLNKPSYGLDTPQLLKNTVEGVLKGGSNAGTSARDAGKALKNLLGL